MNSIPRHGTVFLSKATVAFDILLWLASLPIRLRICTLPVLLKRLTPSEGSKRKMPVNDVVWLVTHLSNLKAFRSRIFPRTCLRQSLALYRSLSHMGYGVEIHFGIRKDGDHLQGHSWVTMEGNPVAERSGIGMFKSVYSHPSRANQWIPQDQLQRPEHVTAIREDHYMQQ